MATAVNVGATGNQDIDGMLFGTKWSGAVTYSFPNSPSFYPSGYGSNEPSNNFAQAPAAMQTAINYAVSLVTSYTNISLTYAGTGTSDIRIAQSSSANPTSYAYMPGNYSAGEGGDVWFGTQYNYSAAALGNYYWATALHEFGHALGLKHSNETGGVSNVAVPANHDDLEFSIMSYRSYIGGSTTSGYTNETNGYPETYMANDILALQTLYGANYNTQSGNTVYTWNPATGQESINGVAQLAVGNVSGNAAGAGGSANRIFMTVWDGNGVDTYDFSNYTTNLSIDLNPGNFTITSTAQLANLGNGHFAQGNVYNAYLDNGDARSYIENAIGGSGNDTIIGNAIANSLSGGSGNDTITGGAGNDTIDGGQGTDTAVFSGNRANYLIVYAPVAGTFTVTDLRSGSPDGTDTITNVENFQFGDGTVATSTLMISSVQAPVISSLTPDTGVSSTDHITSATQVTLGGTAPALTTVKVYDGVNLVGTVGADINGNWTATVSSLTSGSHNFTATATDIVDGTSGASSTFAVTIDTSAPAKPVISGMTPDTGTSSTDGITSATQITLSGTAEANSTVNVYDGVNLVGTVTANGSGNWTDTVSGLSSTTHSFTATATDVAGNLGAASNTFAVTVDTAAPVAPAVTSVTANSGSTYSVSGTAEANSVVTISDGSTVLTSVTANGSGVWTYTTGALSNAVHTLTETAKDSAGNISVVSGILLLGTNFVQGKPAGPGGGGSGAQSASGIDSLTGGSGSDFIVGLGGNDTINGAGGNDTAVFTGAKASYTVTYSSSTQTFTVTDNRSGSPDGTDTITNVENFKFSDVTVLASSYVPVTIATPSIASFSPDTGNDNTDHITNATQITLSGTAVANDTISIYDGSTLLGTASVDGSGNWTKILTGLTNGGHNLTAVTSDNSGHNSAASTVFAVTVDTSAPAKPVIGGITPDTGSSSSDGVTSATQVTLSGTAEANSTVNVYDGANLVGTVTSNGSGAWTDTVSGLATGTHNFTATATDVAGNLGAASTAYVVKVDTQAPAKAVISSFSPDTGSQGDGKTAATQITLSGTAEASSTVKVYDGANLVGTVTADGSGNWTDIVSNLNNSAHSFTATATDAAGNLGSTSDAFVVTVNNVPLAKPAISGLTPDTGSSNTDHITSATQITLSGTAVANATVNVYDGSALAGTTSADVNGNWTDVVSSLGNGGHSFTAVASDSDGNTSPSSSTFAVTIDTIAPAKAVISGMTPDTGTSSTDGITSATQVTLSGTAEANSTINVYDGANLVGTVTATSGGAWTDTVSGLSSGGHSFTATATDVAGNLGAASNAFAMTVDTAAPNAPAVTSLVPNSGSTFSLGGTAEANAIITISDGSTVLGSVQANGSGNWSYTTGALSNALHTLTETAKDAAGNVSGASALTLIGTNPVAGHSSPGGGGAATGGTDTLTGGTGNDFIDGLGGNDKINGGQGTDTAVFSGNQSNYSVSYNSSTQTLTVTDTRSGSPDGTDTITNVENFKFADTTVSTTTYGAPNNPNAGSAGIAGDTFTFNALPTTDHPTHDEPMPIWALAPPGPVTPGIDWWSPAADTFSHDAGLHDMTLQTVLSSLKAIEHH